jgi:hypothetical protein
MSGAQCTVQDRLDDYLMDPTQPLGGDLVAAVCTGGARALEGLWDLVDPIRAEWLLTRVTPGRAA